MTRADSVWRAILPALLVASGVARGLVAAGPPALGAGGGENEPSAQTCCARVVVGERWVVVLDNHRQLWRRTRAGREWEPFPPLAGRVQDVSGADGHVWVLGGGQVALLDGEGVVKAVFPAPDDTWAVAAGSGGAWTVIVDPPGSHELRFSWMTAAGAVTPGGTVTVPLSAEEAVLFKTTPSPYRALVDAVHLAAGDGECAAFFRERSVFVPCRKDAAPVRWPSRGSELEPMIRALEVREKLPPVPLPQVAQVVSCRGSYWVLEHVTGFDAQTGGVTHRDRVRRVGRDGTLRGEILLGGTAMGIAVLDSQLFALMGDGSLKQLAVEP